MKTDELTARFFESLFDSSEEHLIVHRLLNDNDEHDIIDDFLSSKTNEEKA